MAKISISDITSGYNLSKINAAIQEIEDHLNNKVLYRNNPVSEPNSMQNDLDANGNDILNVNLIQADDIQSGGVSFLSAMQTIYDNYAAITQNVTISTSPPSGGADGDIWFTVNT